MIAFDLEQDQSFLVSLNQLGDAIADAVLTNLEEVASKLDWDEFVANYSWRNYELAPIDTYPGANPLYIFTIPLEAGMRPPEDLVDVYCQRSMNAAERS